MSEMLRTLNRGYELIWREGRVEEGLRGLAPDFEWIVPNHPEGEVYRGPDEVLRFFRDWMVEFPGLRVDWELTELDSGRALAVFTQRGQGEASGAPVEMRNAQIWSWRDRRFTRMVLYHDVDEARRDAGLGPRSLTHLAYRGTELFQRGGIDASSELLADDIVWEEDPEWPDRETWHGRDEVLRGFGARLESTTITPTIEYVVEGEERVLVMMHWVAEGHGSGAVADLHVGVVYDFEGDLVKRARFFLDQDRAREAFG
jgi:ketosteroid isomerase-like protein